VDALISINRDIELSVVLERIIDAAVHLADARYGAIGILDPSRSTFTEFLAVGIDPAEARAIGELPKGHGVLGVLITEPKPLRLPDLRAHPDSCGFPPNHPAMRSFLGVPIAVRQEVFGNLYLTEKRNDAWFTERDEEVAEALARAAGVVIENARLHARISELILVEDRERIAKDLHDTVIQRLFATGLSLQATAQLTERPEVAARIYDAVDDLDTTVKHIRTAIFGLETSPTWRDAFRSRALLLTQELSGALGFLPELVFAGPVDTAIPPAAAGDCPPNPARGSASATWPAGRRLSEAASALGATTAEARWWSGPSPQRPRPPGGSPRSARSTRLRRGTSVRARP